FRARPSRKRQSCGRGQFFAGTSVRGLTTGYGWSTILFAHRTEHVECLDRLVEGDHPMPYVAGDAVQVACLKRFLFRTNVKNGFAFEDHPHLFVRMRMLLDDRAWREVDDRDHQLLAR